MSNRSRGTVGCRGGRQRGTPPPQDDDGYLCCGGRGRSPLTACFWVFFFLFLLFLLSIRLLHAIDFSVSCLLFDSAHVCTTPRERRTIRSHQTGQKTGRTGQSGITAAPGRGLGGKQSKVLPARTRQRTHPDERGKRKKKKQTKKKSQIKSNVELPFSTVYNR